MAVNFPSIDPAQLHPVAGVTLGWAEANIRKPNRKDVLVISVGDHLAAGPDRVRERLSALGRATRELLDGVSGWRIVEPVDEPSATTTLLPPDGVDVVATRTRLLAEHGIVTTAIGPERAPGEMSGPVLRISPHLDATLGDLEALAAGLLCT